MTEKTVTVDGTEVIIRETAGGYEAEEAAPAEGFYVRGESNDGYGFEVPLGADAFEIEHNSVEYRDTNNHLAAWDTEADVSNLSDDGAKSARDVGDADFDGYAAIDTVEVVER